MRFDFFLVFISAFVLIIRMGKRKLGESDSDIDDTDDEEENEKSIVLHNGNNSDSSKEAERSSGSVTGGKQDGGSSGGGSCESGSEEEKEIAMQGRLESDELSAEDSPPKEQNHVAGPVTQDEKIVPSLTLSSMELEPDEKMDYNDPVIGNVDEAVGQSPKASCSGCGEGVESTSIVPEVSPSLESNKEVREETAASTNVTETDKPLNFDEYNSAAEMEVCLEISFLDLYFQYVYAYIASCMFYLLFTIFFLNEFSCSPSLGDIACC